jgi:hypothetical protein
MITDYLTQGFIYLVLLLLAVIGGFIAAIITIFRKKK